MASGFGDKDTKGRGGTAKGTGGDKGKGGGGGQSARRRAERRAREKLGGDRHDGAGTGAGRNVSPGRDVGDPGKKNDTGTKTKTLLGMLTEQTHFVEGHAAKLGSLGKKASRADIAAQQARWDAEFALRKKIKPIRDPDKVDVTSKKKRTKQKQRGRVGTTTLSNAETLG